MAAGAALGAVRGCVEGLDLRAMTGDYRGSGEASYHPSVLLGLLVHGYATGMFSSRKPERATYASVSFRFITANQHPDHDTIATFRRRFLKQIATLAGTGDGARDGQG
jgi:transposase